MAFNTLHEFPCSFVPYDEMMQELNKIKARLPKDKWKDLSFQIVTGVEFGTWDEYTRLAIVGKNIELT